RADYLRSTARFGATTQRLANSSYRLPRHALVGFDVADTRSARVAVLRAATDVVGYSVGRRGRFVDSNARGLDLAGRSSVACVYRWCRSGRRAPRTLLDDLAPFRPDDRSVDRFGRARPAGAARQAT